MHKLLSVCVLLAVCGCDQKVVVPTIKELIDNPQILAEWQAKCDTGEYSHLPAAQKADMCFTTQEAARSVAVAAAGKAEADFFEANTLRKEAKP